MTRPRLASHAALRDGTRAEHDRLDALFAGFDLGDPAAYAAFLSAHAQALVPLEAALDAAGAARLFPYWAARRRSALLAADLAALGKPLPDPDTAPDFASDARIAGAIYVVEGSRLGGRMLARRVPPVLPASYLDPGQVAGSWPNLLARIDALLYDRSRLSAAIDAARDVFATFETAGRLWLRKV